MSRYKNFKEINDDKVYKDKMNSIYTKEDNFCLKIDIKDGVVRQEMVGDGGIGLYAIIKALFSLTNKMNLNEEYVFDLIKYIYSGEDE